FIGLTCIYVADFFASLAPDLKAIGGLAERALGFFRIGTGFWLMYLTFAVALNFVLGYTLPLWPASAEGEGVRLQARGQADRDRAVLRGGFRGDRVDVGRAGDLDDLGGPAGGDGERPGAAHVEVDVRRLEGELDPGALAGRDRLLAHVPVAGQ